MCLRAVLRKELVIHLMMSVIYIYQIITLNHFMMCLCLYIQELIDVFNNVLNETNEGGWTALQTIGSGSQTLLQNAERYGAYLATTVNNTDKPLMLVRENISKCIIPDR